MSEKHPFFEQIARRRGNEAKAWEAYETAEKELDAANAEMRARKAERKSYKTAGKAEKALKESEKAYQNAKREAYAARERARMTEDLGALLTILEKAEKAARASKEEGEAAGKELEAAWEQYQEPVGESGMALTALDAWKTTYEAARETEEKTALELLEKAAQEARETLENILEAADEHGWHPALEGSYQAAKRSEGLGEEKRNAVAATLKAAQEAQKAASETAAAWESDVQAASRAMEEAVKARKDNEKWIEAEKETYRRHAEMGHLEQPSEAERAEAQKEARIKAWKAKAAHEEVQKTSRTWKALERAATNAAAQAEELTAYDKAHEAWSAIEPAAAEAQKAVEKALYRRAQEERKAQYQRAEEELKTLRKALCHRAEEELKTSEEKLKMAEEELKTTAPEEWKAREQMLVMARAEKALKKAAPEEWKEYDRAASGYYYVTDSTRKRMMEALMKVAPEEWDVFYLAWRKRLEMERAEDTLKTVTAYHRTQEMDYPSEKMRERFAEQAEEALKEADPEKLKAYEQAKYDYGRMQTMEELKEAALEKWEANGRGTDYPSREMRGRVAAPEEDALNTLKQAAPDAWEAYEQARRKRESLQKELNGTETTRGNLSLSP